MFKRLFVSDTTIGEKFLLKGNWRSFIGEGVSLQKKSGILSKIIILYYNSSLASEARINACLAYRRPI